MRRIVYASAAMLALASCNEERPEPAVTVSDAWVQLPAVKGRPGAAYFKLASNNDPTKLVGVTSPRIERIELHDTVEEGGVSRMRKLTPDELVFPKDLEMSFAPGGRHAMLLGIDPALRPGDRITLTFTVEPMAPVSVEVEVRAFGEGHGAH
jgi:copper(I)-binding protein